ncbi:MAG: Tex-like protein, partial [Spirochaetes bacterium GWB1_27_13]
MEINEVFINSLLINQAEIERKISEDLNISVHQVRATVDLLKTGSTIPFISRYRKEATGSLDEVQVRDVNHKLLYHENIESRRIEIAKGIFGQGKLTEELYTNIAKATTYAELEDLYAPFKRKKKTRGMIAIEKGLEELANLMENVALIEKEADRFVNEEKGVKNVKEALQGAMDIIAERISHDVDNRKMIKDFIFGNGNFVVKGLKNEETSVYKMYYNYKEPIKTVKSHRILAINRGEREEELEAKIDFEEEDCNKLIVSNYIISNEYHKDAILDGLKRLLVPAVLREIRSDFTEEADKHGIGVFAENLTGLLMQPPIKKTRVLGIDPGIRTGTKAVGLDENGKYLGYFLFYQERKEDSKKAIVEAVKKYNVELIAVGNGTGSHEVQIVVADAITQYNLPVQYTVVDEDGASVYSASDTAREEFPDLDLTIRGAISIGRRIQDPLAELVKIDPKSIGVGLYQHDVNQTQLSSTLDEVVESVVNKVGVNVNTASFSLLKYASGITTFVAKNIVEYRNDFGTIKAREDLRKISGFGEKTFEQAAGFLKIPESPDPLDNTWVHPENYEVAREILEVIKLGKGVPAEQKQKLSKKYDIGEQTITDIIEELKKPNRDPRDGYPKPIMQKGVVSFDDLKQGMKVTGKVKNVVDFGAFIDIGIKETALIHLSQMSDKFIKSPSEVLRVGDVKEFEIIE